MKSKLKKEYEVFNMNTGHWEKKVMTEQQYNKMVEESEHITDSINAEYKIISKIIEQNLNISQSSNESMD
jgi:hypothetical protein|tara:strand:+ start:63 stop:272 length:210 start_codon:yes stop_codon:yes gene_type:complete